VNNKDIRIIHHPFGIEQPYFQQLFERFPRMPHIDEPVVVGVVMQPMAAAETLLVHWTTQDNATSGCATAICLGSSDSVGNSGCERYWIANLPAMHSPGTMRYHFTAQTGDTVVHSEEFTYSVGPLTVPSLLQSHVDLGQNGVVCTLKATGGLPTQLQIGCTPTGPVLMYSMKKQQSTVAQGTSWKIADSPQSLVLTGSTCSVTIDKHTLCMSVRNAQGAVLVQTQGAPRFQELHTKEGQPFLTLKQSFDAPEQEIYTGFGERYTALDQRGNILCNRVFEQYKNQRLKTYIPMPYFMTNRGWGLFADTTRQIEFDMAARDSKVWSFEAELAAEGTFVLNLLIGGPKEIYRQFVSRFPACTLPADWVFGPWMSSNEWNSQKRVGEVLQTTKDLDIPATVLVIEAWSDETTFFIWNDARYTPTDPARPPRLADFTFPKDGLWPDPLAMTEAMADQGVHLVLWQIPVVKNIGQEDHPQHRLNEAHVQKMDYILRNPDGSIYKVLPGWFHHSMMIDFENPEAREWWFSRRRYLMEELGVSGFKTDGGEHLWGYDILGTEGSRGDELINTFPQSYIQGYTEELNKVLGPGKGILFSRSGYLGAQSTPAHWTGDQDSTWQTFRSVVYAMMHASLSGIPFMGWDIGGFTGDFPSAELYLRSAATAAFSPIMQYHSEFNHHREPNADRTPWNVAERTGEARVVAIYRMFAKLRMALVPYLMEEASHAIAQSEPLVRPLFVEYPTQEEAWRCDTQYFLGRHLMVAPVIEEGASSRDVYLPPGTWTDMFTGELLQGDCHVTRTCPLDYLPLFRRESALPSATLPALSVFQNLRNSIK